MKKNLFFYLFAVLSAVSLFTSCSSEEDLGGGNSDMIVGTWQLADIVKDENETFVSGPVKLTWETTTPDATIGELPIMMIPAMANGFGSGALVQVLKEITFTADGNISAVYSEKVPSLGGDPIEPEWKDSGFGYATYKKVNDNQILLFLNLEKIMASQSKDTNNPLEPIIELLTNGIPVNVSYDNGKAYFYIDKSLIDKIAPSVASLADLIPDDALGGMGAMLKPILKDLPNAMDKTSKFEAGLILKK